MSHINEDQRKTGKPNRLASEKSPYLLQHAFNPVDWHPWGEEAFDKARREDRPVFLSIGYSTCHWCHVMEKESFEDPEVAALMNDAFVSVKVDREERPDLDHVYMAVCQALTGRGGWPMSILMTPEKKPFYAGTYIPKGNRFGQPGMMSLIPHINRLWKERRGEVLHSADEILNALKGANRDSPKGALDAGVLDTAYHEFLKRFDPVYGGFAQAPKFPSPHQVLFLLRYWKRTGKPEALNMVEKTLREMRLGGIFDQIGYGFHRYSTDREWLVPHFEKMLYDQAMLTLAYLETYQATGVAFYGETAKEVFTYLLRDMTSPEGGFYSAEDADSEGVEGRFYVWKKAEILDTLGPEEGERFCRVFHVEKSGNFFEETTHRNTGANILYPGKELPEIASDLGLHSGTLRNRLAASGKRLFQIREKRIRPHKDDKVLTDWNGLMIAALARGSRVLDEPLYEDAAKKASDFILTCMRRGDGRLLHRYREGEAGILAHLDDYAFLIWGLIELYEATYEPRYLKEALRLNEEMLAHFWDGEKGGLFFAADDAETLIIRNKEAYDGAIPSGNGVAMLNLLTLARLTGRTDLEEKAERIRTAFSGQITQMPSAFSQFLVALAFALGPCHEVVIVGPSGAEGTTDMLRALRKTFNPGLVTLFRPSDRETPEIDETAPFLRTYIPLEGKATAYVCTGHACNAPTTEIRAMQRMLKQGSKEVH